MTNKEICFKYQEIEEKAIKIAKEKGQCNYYWWDKEITIKEDGVLVVFKDCTNCKEEFLITWEELNDKN